MNNLKKSIFDSNNVLIQKTNEISKNITTIQSNLLEHEIKFINALVAKLSCLLPADDFSCKRGVLMYTFKYKDVDREVYISPDVYLIEGDCIVYEVLNPKEYSKVSTNDILISRENKYFCEIALKDFLQYVSPEEIYNFLNDYINEDYKELEYLQKRQEFIKQMYVKK